MYWTGSGATEAGQQQRFVGKGKETSIVFGRCSSRLLHLVTLGTFLTYLLAGASLALPAAQHCDRCSRGQKVSAIQSGAACPLSARGPHCHTAHRHTAGKISMCPDGCLHHEQGGEVSSVAKFLFRNAAYIVSGLPIGPPVGERQRLLPDGYLTPPTHPPPTAL